MIFLLVLTFSTSRKTLKDCHGLNPGGNQHHTATHSLLSASEGQGKGEREKKVTSKALWVKISLPEQHKERTIVMTIIK